MLGKHMNAMPGVSASRRMHEYEPFQVLEGVEEVNFFLCSKTQCGVNGRKMRKRLVQDFIRAQAGWIVIKPMAAVVYQDLHVYRSSSSRNFLGVIQV
jgi:hypothetical protein